MMRQFPKPELPFRQALSKGRATSIGASVAAAAGATFAMSRTATSEETVLISGDGQTAPEFPDASLAAEPVLIATFGADAPLAPVPAATALPPADIIATAEPVELAQAGTPIIATTEPVVPVALPVIATPAVALVSNVTEVAQASAPAGNGGSFWPEGHWEDDASNGGGMGGFWSGVLNTGLSVSGTAFLIGAGYLFWRSINTKPEFDHDIVYEDFKENPCGDPDSDTVYVAPGKDADGDDLTYSIVASDNDDSSLVQIDAETGEVTFINDPLYFSPGDLDRDGTYHFTIEVEDEDGHTARQVVNLTIEQDAPSPFVQTAFAQQGGTTCGDDFHITDATSSPSLFDISGGTGNDIADINGVVNEIGIDLGAGDDTFFQDYAGANDILVKLGEGRDTIELDQDILSLVIQDFDADDLVFLDGGRITPTAGLTVQYYSDAHTDDSPLVKTSEAVAVAALPAAGNYVIAYQNGEDSFLLVGASGSIETTIKFEDVILTDYSQIIV